MTETTDKTVSPTGDTASTDVEPVGEPATSPKGET